jgi:serine/threonine-protein kinase
MGLVYRAYHEGLARQAAVKVLQALAPDLETTARFRREAQAIAQMRHPNILHVFDFGEYEGVPYMIVEFVPGGTLAERLRHGSIEWPATIKILRGVASGLDYAHGLGVVHRDVKPANVLLGRDSNPILADFGLAKLLQAASLKTLSGATTGTPAYMSPEQVTGHDVGPEADRYALATIAYELLTGEVPFEGEGVFELLYAHVHRDPPVASTRKPELSPVVDQVLRRGLAKDPEARWGSCAEFVSALDSALAGKPVPEALLPGTERIPNLGRSIQPGGAGLASQTLRVAAPSRRGPRWTSMVVTSGLLAVILGAGVVGYLVTRPPQPSMVLATDTVKAGESDVVTLQNLPSNQQVVIRLDGNTQIGAGRASASGDLSTDITVPRQTAAGGHTVRACWNGNCPVSTPVKVDPPAR